MQSLRARNLPISRIDRPDSFVELKQCVFITLLTSIVFSESVCFGCSCYLLLLFGFCLTGLSYTSMNCDQEVSVRIGKAAGVFSKLSKLWKSKRISLPVKTRLYEALVLSVLLNSADLWPVCHPNEKKTLQHTTNGKEVSSWGFPGRTK